MKFREQSVDPVVLGQRLIHARKARAITQQDASEHLGVSRPTFIAIEKGTRPIKPDELIRLAAFYGRHVHELIRPSQQNAPIEPHLRAAIGQYTKHEDNTALDKAVAELCRFVEDYRHLEQLVGAKPFADYPSQVRILESIDYGEFAEDVAIRERARLHLGDQPLLNLRQVLEDGAGLRIFYGDIPSTIAGLYSFIPELGFCVLINRKHPPERRRWTMAHEYMHFLVDRYKPGVDYLVGERKPLGERRADAFAASFLMPKTSLRRHFTEIASSTGDFQVADLCRLSTLYFVSIPAMTLRLESLGLIRKGTWTLLEEQQFKPEQAKRRLGLQVAITQQEEPYPERYKYLAIQAFCRELISEGQLAQFLRCDRVKAREIVEDSQRRSDDINDQGQQQTLDLAFEQSLLNA